MKKALWFVYFFVLSMLMFSVYAFAYIDPSAMTYLIQIIAGVLITVGASLGFYWRKIKRSMKKKDEDAPVRAKVSDDDPDDDKIIDVLAGEDGEDEAKN